MKKYFASLIIAILLSLTISAMAADQVNVVGYTPTAYSRLTVTTLAASQLSSSYVDTAGAVFITVETNNIRYRIDGGTPSFNFGHLVNVSAFQNIWLNDPASIKAFRVIAIGGNAILHITYYKRNL